MSTSDAVDLESPLLYDIHGAPYDDAFLICLVFLFLSRNAASAATKNLKQAVKIPHVNNGAVPLFRMKFKLCLMKLRFRKILLRIGFVLQRHHCSLNQTLKYY